MSFPHHHHEHVPGRRVVAALVVTVLAAAAELVGSAGGGSLFLQADAVHLLAHVGIFGVLLVPASWWPEASEDVAVIVVLVVVAAIAAGVTIVSVEQLRTPLGPPPVASVMLLALLGLGANLFTAYLFADSARRWWAFRAALAHELSDGALTIAGLFGALAIWLCGWRWVDPALSLAIGLWLGVWSLRLLVRRTRLGPAVWRH